MGTKPDGGQIKSPEQYQAERDAAKARKKKNAGHGNKRSPKPTVRPKVVVSEVARATKRHQSLVTTRCKQAELMQEFAHTGFINTEGRKVEPLKPGSPAEQLVAKALKLFRAGKNSCVNRAVIAADSNSDFSQAVISLSRHFFNDLTNVAWETMQRERERKRLAAVAFDNGHLNF